MEGRRVAVSVRGYGKREREREREREVFVREMSTHTIKKNRLKRTKTLQRKDEEGSGSMLVQ